jgi:hypothetical protein
MRSARIRIQRSREAKPDAKVMQDGYAISGL